MRWMRTFIKPVTHQLPLFIIIVLVLGGDEPLYRLFRKLFLDVALPSLPFLTDITLRFGFVFLQAYLITALVNFVNRKWFKGCIYIYIIGLMLVRRFLRYNFHAEIGPLILQLVADTNASETSEFLATYAFTPASLKAYGIVAASIIIIIVCELLRKRIGRLLSSRLLAPIVALLTFVGLGSGIYMCGTFRRLFESKSVAEAFYWYDPNVVIRPTDLHSKFIYSVVISKLVAKEVVDAQKTALEFKDTPVVATCDSTLNIVVIVGESFNKFHSTLYGYPLLTSPRLAHEKEIGNLCVFSDFCSSYNTTTESLKGMFSMSTQPGNNDWFKYPTFFQVFKQAGFNVQFWDNQLNYGQFMPYNFVLSSYIYDPKMLPLMYSQRNEHSLDYDGDIVNDFIKNATCDPSKRNLTVFHLIGQHMRYDERYPHTADFEHFTADSIKRNDSYLTPTKKSTIAQYDNATRYNDWVIGQIIDYFVDRNAVLFYFSDHGEEVYDFHDYQGRDHAANPSPMTVKYQFSVPMLVWTSSTYRQLHPNETAEIQAAVDRPGSLDGLSQMLLHIAGIKELYEPTRDILSPDYQPRPRLLPDINVNYDDALKKLPTPQQ